MRMKRMAAAVVAMVTALALTACAGGFDASKYVNGVLNNIYLGDSTGYMELVDITADEAKEEYEQGIGVEADFFLQYYGLDSVSDDVYQQIVDMYKQIYSKSKFEVKDAVKNGDDFNVEVVVSPIDVIVNSEDAISTAVDDFVANANPDDYTDDQVLNDDLAKLVIKVINDNMSNLGYQAEKSIIVKVEKQAVDELLKSLPGPLYQEITALFEEMDAQETKEARVYKALDKLEAVIQHNQSDIRTWLPLEYDLQKTYAAEAVKGVPFLERLQEESVKETERKIEEYSRK